MPALCDPATLRWRGAAPGDLPAWDRMSRQQMTALLTAIWTAAPAARDLTGDLTYHDWFCGAGGSSQGAAMVPGIFIKAAANHWKTAIDTHTLNFPEATHKTGDIRNLDLSRIPPAMIFWSSPECPYWSQGRGEQQTFTHQASLFDDDEDMSEHEKKAAAERSRALMWNVVTYLGAMASRGQPVLAGVVENVIDVCKWIHFTEWRRQIELLGYKTRLIAFNSMHAQPVRTPWAPQSRDRFYLAYWHRKLGRDPDWDKWLRPRAWCPACEEDLHAVQAWRRPGTTMGRYRQQYDYLCPRLTCRGQRIEPYVLPAAAVLNWANLGKRLGDRKRRRYTVNGETVWLPLAPKTMARIKAGFERYAPDAFIAAAAGNTCERHPGARTWQVMAGSQPGLACPPLLVPTGGTWNEDAQPVTGPMRTRLTRECEGLAIPPFMVEMRNGHDTRPVTDPMSTMTTHAHHGLAVPAYLIPLRSGRNRSMPVTDPLATIVADGSNHGLVIPDAAFLMRNNDGGAEMCTPVREPARTLTAKGHQSLVSWQSLLLPYYQTGVAHRVDEPVGALSTRDRWALATELGMVYDPDEILFRMLQVAEIHAAMAFMPGYQVLGKPGEKIRQLGNAVTPPVAEVLISALVETITGTPLPSRWDLAA
jgi:DNA (cytosine-5)-methyltransferase 1